MKLLSVLYKCDQCHEKFEDSDLPTNTYGQFILRSEKTRDKAILNAISDEAYNFVADYIDQELPNHVNKILLLNTLFSQISDHAPDGTHYLFNQDPICPRCGNRKVTDWEIPTPELYLEENIPSVTHSEWDEYKSHDKKNYLTTLTESITNL